MARPCLVRQKSFGLKTENEPVLRGRDGIASQAKGPSNLSLKGLSLSERFEAWFLQSNAIGRPSAIKPLNLD